MPRDAELLITSRHSNAVIDRVSSAFSGFLLETPEGKEGQA